MRLLEEATSYMFRTTAERRLLFCLQANGLSPDDVRWLILVNSEGRFVPVVMHDNNRPELVLLVHEGIGVIG